MKRMHLKPGSKIGRDEDVPVLGRRGEFLSDPVCLAAGDPVFSSLNGLTTLGALLNLYYSVFPRP